ncbi:hypothetical protein LTS18_008975 [Coniosporium uncinatum]|uniref:Uncharacterized protein n=1 Tax=Coniosporium uncinatum TaxID=93489 RepID=A0ACC3DMM9_9PEZI|nr:hypothetical protein LTS18_008975 [Coniosporium uncinatum]
MPSYTLPHRVSAVFQPRTQSANLVLTELDLSPPKPNSDEHLIEVHATALCASELLWAMDFSELTEPDRIALPCGDLSRIVIFAPVNSLFQPSAEVDLVVDMLRGQILADAWTAVRDGGILLGIKALPEMEKPPENMPKDVTNYFFVMEPKEWQLRILGS